MQQKINCIGVLTSGGDAPGMNAAVRSVVRSALHQGLRVKGISYGYRGLYEGNFHDDGSPRAVKNIFDMTAGSVGDVVHRGGTILRSARLPEFKDPAIRAKAAEVARKEGIDTIVVLGGDGTFVGALKLHQEQDIRVVGIPCTIDNDLAFTDVTIGFDTAINTVVDAINELRDTMNSHDRISVVEVMGNRCGDIAIYAGVAAGAEAILIPESDLTDEQRIEHIVAKLEMSRRRDKKYGIIVMSEGVARHTLTTAAVQGIVEKAITHIDEGATPEIVRKSLVNAAEELTRDEFTPQSIARELGKRMEGIDARGTVLGHIQRGGSPTASDRILASRLGLFAVDRLLSGDTHHAVGMKESQPISVPIADAVAAQRDRKNRDAMIRLAEILAT